MQKIAALYDIHGNLPALDAILAEVETIGVDAIIIGGDALAGPMPTEVLARLRLLAQTTPTHFIVGNHESEMLRYLAGEPIGGLTPQGEETTKWVAAQLSAEQHDVVRGWQSIVQLTHDGVGDILFCHATPRSDVEIFSAETPTPIIAPAFANTTAPTVICGHTHMQFDRHIGDCRVINAGSVGMPFGRIGADWLLISDTIQHRHTDYDFEAAAAIIRQTPYPDADLFADGNILNAPAVADVMVILNKFAAQQRENNNL